MIRPSSVASIAASRPSVNCTAGTFRAPFMSEILPAIPTDQLEFLQEAHVGLVVGHGVARRAHVDRARHLDIVVAEHALPRHVHVLEQHRGVVLVETAGERIVELADRVFLIRFARPDADARRVERHHAGDRFLLLPRRHRLQVAAPGLVAEHRRGAEHLQPVDGDATVVLGDDTQGRRRALPVLFGSAIRQPCGLVTVCEAKMSLPRMCR